MLVLEGELVDRRKAFALNHPIGDLVSALPALCQSPLPPRIKATVRLMEQELRRVDFRYPEPFRGVYFWPLGLDGKRAKPFKNRKQRPFESSSDYVALRH